MQNLLSRIHSKYKDYKIIRIESGASKRNFYRLLGNDHSIICMDSSKEQKSYSDYLKIHSYLKNINISIPKIYDQYDQHNILLLEDFNNFRFDKIFSKFSTKKLLKYAVDTLLIMKKEINFNDKFKLNNYSFENFKSEISEFVDYYYPHIYNKKINENNRKEFFDIWKYYFNSVDFDFKNFVHKDFNLNNLMYLESRKDHLKCGVLDFQSAFWGESSWDLFSLLEDSRILYDDQFNNYFIEYYFNNSNLNSDLNDFKQKYYILNCSRQTRLMGRWVKLSKELNQKWYLNFIPITKKRFQNSVISLKNNKELKMLYSKLIPNFFDE